MLKFIFDLPPCFQGHKFTCYKIIILLFFRIYIKFLKKYNQNEDIFRNSSAFVIRKAALTCLSRLNCYFVSNNIPSVLGPQWQEIVQLAFVTWISLNVIVSSTVFFTRSIYS